MATKRGRPPGKKPGHIGRDMIVLHVYQRARAEGQKHDIAVDFAVAEAKRLFPDTPTSATKVKNILSACMSTEQKPGLAEKCATRTDEKHGASEDEERKSLIVTKAQIDPDPVFGVRPTATTYDLKIADRPAYPRVNRNKNHASD